MKFGAQLRNKSVPEWRSYNIDYNDLKQRIRITTELPKDDRRVQDLYGSFIEQIDMVNMFLQSKLGEVKRRMQFVASAIDDNKEDEQISLSVESNLRRLSSDLQKLSRFIVIQKTGLRKLLKKYTKYSNDGGELNTSINKYVVQNQDSFVHVDLVGLYLELALLYDLVREKQADHSERMQRSSSSRSASGRKPYQRRSSLINPVQGLNINEVFDFESTHKGTSKEVFLVHYDNLVELKLFLLSNFYLVDQSVQLERKELQLKKQKSAISFRQQLQSRNSSDNIYRQQFDEETSEQPTYRSNSIYTNTTDDLANQGLTTSIILDDPKHLQSIQMNTDPGVLSTNDRYQKRELLISAIGGLRKNSNVLINDKGSFVDELLEAINSGVLFDDFVQKHTEYFNSLDSLERISIEWLFSRHIKPIIKVSSTRTRFRPNLSPSSNFDSWITLSSNLKLSKKDLTNPQWTETNEQDFKTLPYAILEVRFNTPIEQGKLPDVLQKLLTSHLIYKVDDTLTILTYYLFVSKVLDFTPTWAKFFGDEPVDIRKNPPKIRKVKSSVNTTSDVSLKHNSVSGESNQFKYWNEFDNGSETEQGDGFYIDVESDGDTLFPSSGIEYLFKITDKMNSFLHGKLPFMFNDTKSSSTQRLVNNENGEDRIYGSTDHSDVESFSDSASQAKAAHDTLLVFIAVSCSLLSLVLMSVSLGITSSLLSYEDPQVSPIVIAVLVIAMITSLFFSVVSLCFLMMSEAANRKLWQTFFVWAVFIAVTFLVTYGMANAFGI